MIVSRPSHAIIPEAFKFTTTTAKIESHSFGSVKLPEKTYTSDVPHGAALGSATEQQPRINSKGTGGSGSSSNNSGIATQQQHQVTLRTAAAPQQTTNSASSTSVRPTAGASVPDNNKMSVAYEHRTFIHDGSYPPMGEPAGDAGVEIKAGGVEGNGGGYPSPTDVVAELANYAAGADAAAAGGIVDASSSTAPAPTNGTEAASAPRPSKPATQREDGSEAAPAIRRIRAIPKPDREVKQDAEGKYCCTHEGCTDETRKFSRKCEWSKHMDKHDRPYKCTVEGCEKLPGFTYSGGLLRHEREVHHKHGGPKNPLNCPHPNCKRNTGKGFSRQENLNEHMRRVHTNNGLALVPGLVSGLAAPVGAGMAGSDESEDDVERQAAAKRTPSTSAPVTTNGGASGASVVVPVLAGVASPTTAAGASNKRKRPSTANHATAATTAAAAMANLDSADAEQLKGEIKRMRLENDELRQQVEAQTRQLEAHSRQSAAMMQQIAQLQAALKLGAPEAIM